MRESILIKLVLTNLFNCSKDNPIPTESFCQLNKQKSALSVHTASCEASEESNLSNRAEMRLQILDDFNPLQCIASSSVALEELLLAQHLEPRTTMIKDI